MTEEELLMRVEDQIVTENDRPVLNLLDSLVDLCVNDPIAYSQLIDEVGAIAVDIHHTTVMHRDK